MAIVSKLPVDSVLWKYSQKEKQYRMNPQNRHQYMRDERGKYIIDDVDVYYYIRLYTRRARTSGCTIDEKLIPFLQKLKIRIDRASYRGAKPVAVGCEAVRCNSKEEWDNLILHEVAQKYYNKVKNAEIMKTIQHEQKVTPSKAIEELKTLDTTEKPEPEEWPEEPFFYDQTPNWVNRGHF